MQKFTQFLEKNVEWLALGFGGLFLLYMVYAYVLTSPVGVEMGGQKLSLGEIDRHILNNQARALERAMDPNMPAPDLSFESLAGNFQTRMARQGQQPVLLANHWPMFPPQNLNIQRDEGPVQEIPRVAQLPTPPAPTLMMKVVDGVETDEAAIRKGNSSVALPPDPAPGQPGMADRGPDARQVGGPAVIPVQVNQEGSFKREDRLWVSLLYKVSMADVAEAFAEQKMFEAAPGSQTAFLQVEVEREERTGNNEWGNRVVVPNLQNAMRPPMPPETVANPQEVELVNQYVNWAAQNAVEILKPAFYPVLAGTEWLKPGEADVQLVQETEEERIARLQQQKAERDAERERRRNEARQRRPAAGERTMPRSRRGDDDMDYAPIDRDRPARRGDQEVRFEQARRRPPAAPRGYPPQDPAMDPTMMDEYGEYPMDEWGMQPQQRQPGDPALQEIPLEVTQKFQPTAEIGDVEMWVHDDTVKAGETYRYRVRYKMANPILGWFGVAQPAELQNQVYIVSAWSEWSPNVRMDSLVQFFASGTGLSQQQTVRFDVFKWEGGFWQQQTFSNLSPGDMIGETRDDVDFTTGMTIVDIRDVPPRERLVVLVDSDGAVVSRNLRADQNSPEYRELLRKAQEDRQRQAVLAPQPGAGGAPGTAPPGIDPRRMR